MSLALRLRSYNFSTFGVLRNEFVFLGSTDDERLVIACFDASIDVDIPLLEMRTDALNLLLDALLDGG